MLIFTLALLAGKKAMGQMTSDLRLPAAKRPKPKPKPKPKSKPKAAARLVRLPRLPQVRARVSASAKPKPKAKAKRASQRGGYGLFGQSSGGLFGSESAASSCGAVSVPISFNTAIPVPLSIPDGPHATGSGHNSAQSNWSVLGHTAGTLPLYAPTVQYPTSSSTPFLP